ncbi:hypothetical protein HMPREF0326_01511 [Desulfovibrio sp. 3_1_syn3]|uniref:hypothetical protein n=1 Tax=Desulfovibrio sp. 3_1_syn3 TaxID=457398 RepID=UPI0001E12A68|nr:hypothetical protein [Desulfovibrio sp. 3_1_syn3]EFL85808.1 hypothetical protein HMPREF0326_01511 [Desulfovibrio sp. 3_1_syn3]
MCRLFDPLAKLTGLGAYAHMDIGPDGRRTIRLTYARMVRANEARKAQTIRARYERLLLLQLDVPPGDRPRTVQQLVASGKIRVVGGKYKRME